MTHHCRREGKAKAPPAGDFSEEASCGWERIDYDYDEDEEEGDWGGGMGNRKWAMGKVPIPRSITITATTTRRIGDTEQPIASMRLE